MLEVMDFLAIEWWVDAICTTPGHAKQEPGSAYTCHPANRKSILKAQPKPSYHKSYGQSTLLRLKDTMYNNISTRTIRAVYCWRRMDEEEAAKTCVISTYATFSHGQDTPRRSQGAILPNSAIVADYIIQPIQGSLFQTMCDHFLNCRNEDYLGCLPSTLQEAVEANQQCANREKIMRQTKLMKPKKKSCQNGHFRNYYLVCN